MSKFSLIPSENDGQFVYWSKIFIILTAFFLFFKSESSTAVTYAGEIGYKIGYSFGWILAIIIISLPIYIYVKFIKKRNYLFFNKWTVPILAFLYLLLLGAQFY